MKPTWYIIPRATMAGREKWREEKPLRPKSTHCFFKTIRTKSAGTKTLNLLKIEPKFFFFPSGSNSTFRLGFNIRLEVRLEVRLSGSPNLNEYEIFFEVRRISNLKVEIRRTLWHRPGALGSQNLDSKSCASGNQNLNSKSCASGEPEFELESFDCGHGTGMGNMRRNCSVGISSSSRMDGPLVHQSKIVHKIRRETSSGLDHL